MFLSRLKECTPNLLKTALVWHQENRIPTNSWVIDLDTIQDNAAVLAAAKRKLGLETYLIEQAIRPQSASQFGRYPGRSERYSLTEARARVQAVVQSYR